MATYWITFRIQERSHYSLSDDARRQALYDAVRSVDHTKWWVEPTSFILFTSNRTIDEIARAITEAIAPAFDVVLIRDAENKLARAIGPIDPDLFELLPYAQAA